jgi:hypothetical protein
MSDGKGNSYTIRVINLELHAAYIQFLLLGTVPREERADVTHGIKSERSLHKV